MKFRSAIAPALAALLATACATSRPASAPERAEQAEHDKNKADEDARQARIDAAEAHQSATDADRAQYEADQRARHASIEAAQAERDARYEQATGVTEAQPATAPYPYVTFATSSYDLTDFERSRLDRMAESLRAHPSRHVVIHTYADDTGDPGKDARLAQRRADAVAHYFENRGISNDRIVIKVVTRDIAHTDRPSTDDGPYRSVAIIVK